MKFEGGATTNLELERGAAFFSVLKDGEDVRLYYRGAAGGHSYTLATTSTDGVNFNPTIEIFRGSHVCHNFYAFRDHRDLIRGIGGQYAPLTTKPNNDGIYSFTSRDGISFEGHGRIISPGHPGYVDGIRLWGKRGEIDGHMCSIYCQRRKIYFIYFRSNPAKGQRFVQFATGSTFGEFGPLSHIQVEGFLSGRDEIYYPNFFLIEGQYFGLLPIVSPQKACIQIVRSHDGVVWRPVEEMLCKEPWLDAHGAFKNHDHVANGVVDLGDRIAVYIHHNYFGSGVGVQPRLTRYFLCKRELLSL